MSGHGELKQRYLEILRARSLRTGRFTLTSGQNSHYYFDAKQTTLHSEGAYLGARLLLETIRAEELQAEAIGGLTLGADPIVAAVAVVSHLEQERFQPLEAFIARKESKGHGTGRQIEGFQGQQGSKVFIVDDVCTTGGSTLKAIRAAEEHGFEVSAVFCLLDREQGGSEALRGYPFFSLFRARELLDDPEIQKRIADLGR